MTKAFSAGGFVFGLVIAIAEEGFNWKYLAVPAAMGISLGSLSLLDTESPSVPILVQYEVLY